ncbi:hypothetical protein GGI42DRAFT_44273 [Trichoderma sp. SZMC 28013]
MQPTYMLAFCAITHIHPCKNTKERVKPSAIHSLYCSHIPTTLNLYWILALFHGNAFFFLQLGLSGFRSFMSHGVQGRNDLGSRSLGGHIVFIRISYYSSFCFSDVTFVVFPRYWILNEKRCPMQPKSSGLSYRYITHVSATILPHIDGGT